MAEPRRDSMRDDRRDAFELSPDDLDLVADLSARPEAERPGAEIPRVEIPGVKDSAILTMDSVLTLIRLFKAEASFAFNSLPQLIGMALFRAPAYVLTWLSFCVFIACVVYTLTQSLLWGAGTLLALQVVATAALELRIRRLHRRIDFPETRKGLAVMQASVKSRLKEGLRGEQTEH